MRRLVVASIALVLLAVSARADGERVTFALPDLQDGETKSRSDFDSRLLLLVYQGMP